MAASDKRFARRADRAGNLLARNFQRIDPRIDGRRLVIPIAKRFGRCRRRSSAPAVNQKLRMRFARCASGAACGGVFQFRDAALRGAEDAIDQRAAARGGERDRFENCCVPRRAKQEELIETEAQEIARVVVERLRNGAGRSRNRARSDCAGRRRKARWRKRGRRRSSRLSSQSVPAGWRRRNGVPLRHSRKRCEGEARGRIMARVSPRLSAEPRGGGRWNGNRNRASPSSADRTGFGRRRRAASTIFSFTAARSTLPNSAHSVATISASAPSTASSGEFTKFAPAICFHLARLLHSLRIVDGDLRAFAQHVGDKIDRDRGTDVVRVRFKGEPPDRDFFFAQNPERFANRIRENGPFARR